MKLSLASGMGQQITKMVNTMQPAEPQAIEDDDVLDYDYRSRDTRNRKERRYHEKLERLEAKRNRKKK